MGPSRELTYPQKMAFWVDDFPFPQLGYVSIPWRVGVMNSRDLSISQFLSFQQHGES